MRVLETDRLILKPVEESDLMDLLEMQWDRDVVTYMKFTPISYDDQKRWYSSLGKNSMAFTMFQKVNGNNEFIGLATLNNIDNLNQRASWGMKIKTNLKGKGIGYEASLIIIHYAFHYLNMQKIHADFLQENSSSLGLVAKIGLRQEGLLINHLYHQGMFRNLVLVGISKDEFYANNKDKLEEYGLV